MFKFLKLSKYTGIIAIVALIISLGAAGLAVADAYNVRTTVLARALQTMGLCPLPETVESKPIPTVIVTAAPEATPIPSVESTPTSSATPSSKPTISSDPSATPVRGATGTSGSDGSAGSAGSTGSTGATGATGEKGEKGDPGAPGSSGSTGPQGPAGVCDLASLLSVDGDIVPAVDNLYSLGTVAKRWKSLQLGPGTLWIQDADLAPPAQVGISVRSGALLLDGANSVRIGSMQMTNTGITSTNHTSPITLGDSMFNSLIQIQATGLRFRDGTTQTTAATGGGVGPAGPPGPQGPQGDPGRDGSIEGFVEVPVCVVTESREYPMNTMVFSKCGEVRDSRGIDIIMLQKKE